MGNTNNSTEEAEEKREKLKIEVPVHEKFNAISDCVYLTSNEFCSKVNKLLRPVFADYEGCILNVSPNGADSQIILYFNHSEPVDPVKYNAITRNFDDAFNGVSNSVVRQKRQMDARIRQGDKYFLTQEGKDALEEFIDDRFFNRNKKIDYGKIMAEVSIPSNVPGMAPIRCTQVSFIDPTKVAKKIYGATDEDGNGYEYMFKVGGSFPSIMNSQSQSGQYACCIERVSDAQVAELANLIGYSPNGGFSICRN